MSISPAIGTGIVIMLAALIDIWVASRAQRRAVHDRDDLLARGINGSALAIAQARISTEWFRVAAHTPFVFGGLSITFLPVPWRLYTLGAAVIAALIIHFIKSRYLDRVYYRVRRYETARVKRKA